jgi:hypothetical protein
MFPSLPDISGAAGAYCTRIIVKCGAFLLRDLGKARKVSVGIVTAGIRTGFPNTSMKLCNLGWSVSSADWTVRLNGVESVDSVVDSPAF